MAIRPTWFFRNFTGFKIIGSFGNFTYQFTAGVIEERAWNFTQSSASAEIGSLVSNEQMIRGGAVAVTGKVLQKSAGFVRVISAATPNLNI